MLNELKVDTSFVTTRLTGVLKAINNTIKDKEFASFEELNDKLSAIDGTDTTDGHVTIDLTALLNPKTARPGPVGF